MNGDGVKKCRLEIGTTSNYTTAQSCSQLSTPGVFKFNALVDGASFVVVGASGSCIIPGSNWTPGDAVPASPAVTHVPSMLLMTCRLEAQRKANGRSESRRSLMPAPIIVMRMRKDNTTVKNTLFQLSINSCESSLFGALICINELL